MLKSQGWLRVYRPVTDPRLRVVCFPHAGAGPTAYRGWIDLVPSDVEVISVCYPGRQDRFNEPFATSVESLAAGIGAALLRYSATPMVLFGHSMGAVTAYETAIWLEANQAIVPQRLFVSGSWAPNRIHERNLEYSDDELIKHIRQLGNTHTELFALAEIRELLLSALRADYRMLSRYRRDHISRVSAPVTAYAGDRDPGCSPAQVAQWSIVTEQSFTVRVVPGDHFYLVPAVADLVDDVVARATDDRSRERKAGSATSLAQC
jgi:pyochelin biosynthetic protein PchC